VIINIVLCTLITLVLGGVIIHDNLRLGNIRGKGRYEVQVKFQDAGPEEFRPLVWFRVKKHAYQYLREALERHPPENVRVIDKKTGSVA
jgi:hypothetical protein